MHNKKQADYMYIALDSLRHSVHLAMKMLNYNAQKQANFIGRFSAHTLNCYSNDDLARRLYAVDKNIVLF